MERIENMNLGQLHKLKYDIIRRKNRRNAFREFTLGAGAMALLFAFVCIFALWVCNRAGVL